MGAQTDSDAYQITWLIRRLFRAMGQKSNESLEILGISAADRAVMEFLYPDKALSVPEIAERYQVSRQHIQVTVNALQEKALVVARENPRHKRSPLIQLNQTGRELFAGILDRDASMIEDWFSTIPIEDRRQTRSILETLFKQLS